MPPIPKPPQGRHEHRIILLVDDEPPVLAVGEKMLARAGFEVLTASDGREAVECFGEKCDEIDCVILDLSMPHLDGAQAFEEMQKVREDAEVPDGMVDTKL